MMRSLDGAGAIGMTGVAGTWGGVDDWAGVLRGFETVAEARGA